MNILITKFQKFHKNVKRSLIVLLFLGVFLLFEPIFKDSLSFAITHLDTEQTLSSAQSEKDVDYTTNLLQPAAPESKVAEKSRAPEFSSLFLLLSGIVGVFVRFVRKSFDRLKRVIDIILALSGLAIASPILLAVGIFIKLTSKGSVIYRQERVGRYGEIFKIYKLRTMHIDAEKNTGAVWARKDDPRITPVGLILRKTHIDEIPQLLNVLKGEMSIVGPRPERPELVRDLKVLIQNYEKRLMVKPGITGLAQVWHKYDETIEDVKKKIKYDILYIKKMCLLVDLRILANTVVVVLTGRGAR